MDRAHLHPALLGAAVSAVTTLVLAILLLPRRPAAPAPADVPSSSEEEKEETEAPKRFDSRREYYDPNSGIWTSREEEEEEKKSFLFTVKHRSWPKSSDYAGNEDYTALEINSQSLIDVLRLQLTEVEEMFEDKPSLDARDLFLHLAALKALLETKKAQLADLEKKKAEQKTAESTEEEKEEGAEMKEDNVEESTAPVADPTASTSALPAVEAPIASEVADVIAATPGVEESDENELAPNEKQTVEEVAAEVDQLGVLLAFVEELFGPTQSKLDRLLKDQQISFALLWALFPTDTIVAIIDENSEQRAAFKLQSCNYAVSRDGPVFVLNGIKMVWTGHRYAMNWVSTRIIKFKGMRKISSLSAHPLTHKHREELTARGKLYTDLAKVAFLNYSGILVQVTGSGMDRRVVKLRAEGRVVVDVRSYKRMNPARDTGMWEDEEDEDELDELVGEGENVSKPAVSAVSEEDLCLLPSTVYGFSLVQREWGELRVDQFSPVIFSSNAYDHLVLDADKKDLIKSLVEQNSIVSKRRAIEADNPDAPVTSDGAVTDVIVGKGGGLVIVLHGRPGVGKTLTAEAVAELIRVPLYAVGAGELGVHATELERRLRDVLDTAQTWGAVLLIDEADVFLEERSLHDVTRNAMVSVFLRLLEYHSGILMLTTNRIRTIDEAFLSRFSIAVTYPDLDVAKRRTIWRSFLELAGVTIEDKQKVVANGIPTPAPSGTTSPTGEAARSTISTKYLDKLAAKSTFNGRSIKNAVRTAQALAQSKGVPLSAEHVDIVVKVTETFATDFREADEAGVYDAKGEGWKDRTHVYG